MSAHQRLLLGVADHFRNEAIDRRTLYRWLEAGARRLAVGFWWHNLPREDWRGLMRLHADLTVRRAYARGLCRELADDKNGREERHRLAHAVLDEAIASVWEEHGASADVMFSTARNALLAGTNPIGVLATVAALARTRVPLPPPWLVRDTTERALEEHRRATFSQHKQRGRAA